MIILYAWMLNGRSSRERNIDIRIQKFRASMFGFMCNSFTKDTVGIQACAV